MPAKMPSTTCVARSRMKFLRMRDVDWLEASASVTNTNTNTIENVTPTTVIIEPAILDNTPRAARRAGAKQTRPEGHPLLAAGGVHLNQGYCDRKAVRHNKTRAKTKMPRRLLQSRLNLFMN